MDAPHANGMGDGAGSKVRDPWSSVLDAANPRDHIVQLYQDERFLSRAVCRFAASALAHGEGLILVPTAAHWAAFRPRLEAEGVDIAAAERRGQRPAWFGLSKERPV